MQFYSKIGHHRTSAKQDVMKMVHELAKKDLFEQHQAFLNFHFSELHMCRN